MGTVNFILLLGENGLGVGANLRAVHKCLLKFDKQMSAKNGKGIACYNVKSKCMPQFYTQKTHFTSVLPIKYL
jgi:hypothetical protein